ncbi:ABC transporter C-terminal domain-containing protein [Rossellomorea vietnamensis]|uniref:ABC transporter C-terminal domain-containing protein n=1 Tax=Rossellomorea vietnamensis TaxID=218284 RepID=UPI003CE840E5
MKSGPADFKRNDEKELAKAQERIEELENEIRKLDIVLAASQSDHEELYEVYRRKLELGDERDSVMEEWLKLAD